MKNEIHLIKNSDLTDLLISDTTHLAILDGKFIQTKAELLSSLGEAYCLSNWSNLDSISDSLRDLDWLDSEGFVLIIKNFNDLLMEEPHIRASFLSLLVDVVLPHWEKDVLYTVLGGLPKSFQLYLVVD